MYLAAFGTSADKIDRTVTVWWSRIDAPYLLHHVLGTSLGRATPLVTGALALRRLGRARHRHTHDELRIAIVCLTR